MLPSEVDVPYPAWPIPEASPARMGAMATLAGMRPASPKSCRVLELGCASGGNLLPLACSHPGSHFVGVDLDAGEIAQASRIAEELELKNVKLLAMSVDGVIETLPNERFDYVIAHGLYSWIPKAAREAVMQLSGALLSEQGIAYVSYNTLPGFELRQVVRDALRYHCRGLKSARQALAEARDLLATLAQSPLAKSSPLIQNELLTSAKANDARLLYDDLGDTEAFYFLDVIEQAGRHGLSFLGEAVPTRTHLRSFGGRAGRRLEELAGDRLAQEALLDVLMLRRFRRSLFRRTSTTPSTASLDALHALARFQRPPISALGQPWTVPGIAGTKVQVTSAHTRAGLWCLGARYPSSVPLTQLRSEAAQLVRQHVASSGSTSARDFDASLLQLVESGVVELLADPVACGSPTDRPAAFRYARLAASTGRPIANLHHRQVSLEPDASNLLVLLDGARDVSTAVHDSKFDRNEPERGAELLELLAAEALLQP